MENSLYTFEALMKKSGLVIPLIQRDYAQGRKTAFGVRKGFVESLHKVLKEGGQLVLDFVYGPIINEVFLPLDGQQRLTTLLLVYWYLGVDMSCWKPFEFRSRRSADRFVAFLNNKTACGKYTLSDLAQREKPSSWLRKQSLFVPAWEKDPTVSGMMTMLDELHSSFVDLKRESAASNLTKIVFYRHECDSAIRADDTYLKINARGEPLTSWENIKAILDARANKLSRRNDEIGEAARDWRKNINGNWVIAVENLIPDKGPEVVLPHYIAMAVSLMNAAFRNVIDLAAMYSMSGISRLEGKARQKYGDRFSTMNYAEAVVGIRDLTSEIKDMYGLERFFIGEFHDHVATYEDYRNEDIFTDEAFVVVSNIFSALSSERACGFKGGWTVDRSKNIMWGSYIPTEEYLKSFVFPGARFSDEVLLESERDGFVEWIGHDERISSVTQASGFTYSNAVRMLLLSDWEDTRESNFAVSRVLNILDNLPEEVNAANFIKWSHDLRCLSGRLKTAKSFEECKSAFGDIRKGNKESFLLLVSSEEEKCRLYFKGGGWQRSFHEMTFGVVERKLGLMAGSVHFVYNAKKGDFDEAMAGYFLKEFTNGDRALENPGYRKILSYLQDGNLSVLLPNKISSVDKWYGDWGGVFKQKQMIDAYSKMYACECLGESHYEKPAWYDCYLKFADSKGWPYVWLASHEMPHGAGTRIFAYNTGSRMGKYCACVQYSDEERLLIDVFQKSGCHCIQYGDKYVRSSDKPQFAIEVESVFNKDGVLKIFKEDAEGKFGKVAYQTIQYETIEALSSSVDDFLRRND